MADNVVANSGSGGATFATDEDTSNSRHFPATKIMLGAENAFTEYWAGQVTNGGTFVVQVDASIPAGTNNIGDVDVLTVPAPLNLTGGGAEASALRVTLANDSTGVLTVDGSVSLLPATTGGLSAFKSIDLDESEEAVKGSAGQVFGIHAMNLAATKMFLKLYNATTGSVTVGTTAPDVTIPLPTQGDTNGAGFTWTIPMGIAFSTAITAAATTGIADDDSGAPGSNEVVVTILYK